MGNVNVKSLRKAMGLSREKFAALIPVNPATVWRWEILGSKPPLLSQKRLEELAGKLKRHPRK